MDLLTLTTSGFKLRLEVEAIEHAAGTNDKRIVLGQLLTVESTSTMTSTSKARTEIVMNTIRKKKKMVRPVGTQRV
jgi:hypothetical protein